MSLDKDDDDDDNDDDVVSAAADYGGSEFASRSAGVERQPTGQLLYWQLQLHLTIVSLFSLMISLLLYLSSHGLLYTSLAYVVSSVIGTVSLSVYM